MTNAAIPAVPTTTATTWTVPTDGPTNNPTGEIHAAMAAILDAIPAIGKDSKNQAQGFSFRSIDAIVNAVNPLLGKYGVVPRIYRSELLHWEPKAKGYAAVVRNTYRLTARDGSWVETQGLGEGADFGDKAVSKANTMAQKVMLGQTFCLATEEDPDGESVEDPAGSGTSSPTKPARQKAAAKAAKTGTASPPAAPTLEQLQVELASKAGSLPEPVLNELRVFLEKEYEVVDRETGEKTKRVPGRQFDKFTADDVVHVQEWLKEHGDPF